MPAARHPQLPASLNRTRAAGLLPLQEPGRPPSVFAHSPVAPFPSFPLVPLSLPSRLRQPTSSSHPPKSSHAHRPVMASHPTQETGAINSASSTSTIVNSSDIPRPGGEPPKEVVQPPSPIVSPYAGAGTEEDPYVIEWLEGDKENPYNCAFLVLASFRARPCARSAERPVLLLTLFARQQGQRPGSGSSLALWQSRPSASVRPNNFKGSLGEQFQLTPLAATLCL